jgi:uncharacterized protein YlxW (UPF0749 family)
MAVDPSTRPLPQRVTMGLLPYLNAHALDEDYADAAARRAAVGTGTTPRRRFGRRSAVVLAVFAVLAMTAAVQTSQDSDSEEKERRALISQVKDRRESVAEQRTVIETLAAENRRLEGDLLRSSDDASSVLANLDLLRLRAGTSVATGPGVEVIADDAEDAESDRNKVLDSDLQKLVNGLWQAGAEAISINGERLTVLSAIRHAGSAITVNFTSLSRPYKILAIGNPETLPGRFADTTSGQAWLDLQGEVGLKFSIVTRSSLRLPAADTPQLRHVVQDEDETVNGEGDS